MNRFIPALVGILCVVGLTVAGAHRMGHTDTQSAQGFRSKPPVDTSLSGPSLAGGFLRPVNPSWWRELERATYENATGRRMSLPRNRPVLFFAWWCPWCHRELATLQRYGDLRRITLVSLYLNAPEKGNKPVVIRDIQDGVRVTEMGLQQAGVHVPPNHVLYVMPNNPLNKIIAGVPVWVERTAFGWYVLNGTPGESAVWPSVLGYTQFAYEAKPSSVRGGFRH
ncbi:MAG: hypothetical protein ACYCYO_10675 [Bacilli bacterium]